MGLDQYLYKKTYIKNWDFMKPEELHKVKITGPKAKDIDVKKICYIEEQVMYWRKANQIHKWFVDNCQDGNDDCRTAWVSREKLKELVDTCKEVLESTKLVEGDVVTSYTFDGKGKKIAHKEKGKVMEDDSVAKKLLPSSSGFFFGGTDYDEWYYKDLENTVKELEPLLKDEDAEYYYSSSW